MRKPASMANLFGALALVISMAAQGAVIQVAVNVSPKNSPPAPFVHTEPDGTVLRVYKKMDVDKYSDNRMYLSISHPSSATKTIALDWSLIDVRSITHGQDGKAIIIGDVSGDVSQVLIVDLASDKIVDKFLAYGPVVSPNGRYIAFTKFYPSHGVRGTSDIELVYDVAKSPQDNRPAGVKLSDDTDVGFGVYPPGATAESGNEELPPSQIVHNTSDFFWAPDSSKLVFSMTQDLPPKTPAQPQNSTPPARKKGSVVLVRFGPPSWLPTAKVYTTDTCLVGIGQCATRVTKTDFGADGVTVYLNPLNAGPGETPTHIKYDQFRTPPGLGG